MSTKRRIWSQRTEKKARTHGDRLRAERDVRQYSGLRAADITSEIDEEPEEDAGETHEVEVSR